MLPGEGSQYGSKNLIPWIYEPRCRGGIKRGLSCNRTAKQLGLGISTAIKWVQRFRQTGSVAPAKCGGYLTIPGLGNELAERGSRCARHAVLPAQILARP